MVSDLFHSIDSSLLILVFFIFLSFIFLIRGIFLYLANPERLHRQRLKKRLRNLENPASSFDFSTMLNQSSLEKSLLDRILVKFSLFNRLRILMLQANLAWRMETFLVFVALSGLVLAGVGLAQWGGLGAVAGASLGLIIPYKILVRKRKRRLQKFEKQLPDALDLLARGLRAGHAFPLVRGGQAAQARRDQRRGPGRGRARLPDPEAGRGSGDPRH